MFLILTDSFLKREYNAVKKHYSIADIKKTARKISVSSVNLSHLGYKNGELLKLRMAGKTAGRIIIYVFRQNNLVLPIVLRLKSDKIMGQNLALNNKKAKILIINMMDRVMEDLDRGNFTKEKID